MYIVYMAGSPPRQKSQKWHPPTTMVASAVASCSQCFLSSQIIGYVTPQIYCFHHLKKCFLDQSIQKTFNVLWKKESLLESLHVYQPQEAGDLAIRGVWARLQDDLQISTIQQFKSLRLKSHADSKSSRHPKLSTTSTMKPDVPICIHCHDCQVWGNCKYILEDRWLLNFANIASPKFEFYITIGRFHQINEHHRW